MHTIFRFSAGIAAAAMLAACALFQPPADLDLRLARPSQHGMYAVTLRPLVDAPAINSIHAWEIGITTRDGKPVDDARIAFSGGMPQHGHGYPTRPRVTGQVGPGRYRLDGVKFSMSGWWEMKLDVQSAHGTDQVVFNTVVAK